MIKIELKLFVTLSRFLPQTAQAYEIADGKTVEELITDLGIPPDLVKLIFVNGRRQESNYVLQAGDRVGLFPPVGGG
ncbi:MAG: MoaD/ThiS family protein [Pseudomonadota bacterium]